MTIVSPFDNDGGDDTANANVATKSESSVGDGPFELTWDKVEMVLDGMRPYVSACTV